MLVWFVHFDILVQKREGGGFCYKGEDQVPGLGFITFVSTGCISCVAPGRTEFASVSWSDVCQDLTPWAVWLTLACRFVIELHVPVRREALPTMLLSESSWTKWHPWQYFAGSEPPCLKAQHVACHIETLQHCSMLTYLRTFPKEICGFNCALWKIELASVTNYQI